MRKKGTESLLFNFLDSPTSPRMNPFFTASLLTPYIFEDPQFFILYFAPCAKVYVLLSPSVSSDVPAFAAHRALSAATPKKGRKGWR